MSLWHHTWWQAWACILFSSWSTGEETESLGDRKGNLPKTTLKGSVSYHTGMEVWASVCVCAGVHIHMSICQEAPNSVNRRMSLTSSDAKRRKIQLCFRLLFSNVGLYSCVSKCRAHHPGLHWGVNVQSRLLSCSNPPLASPPLRASPWNLVGPLSCALDPPPLPFFLLVNLLTQPHTLLCLDQVLDGIRNLYVPSHLQFSWLFTDPLMSPSNLNHNFISSESAALPVYVFSVAFTTS